jgi:N-acetylglutamate synthase-like GNAT family acetyltransferase
VVVIVLAEQPSPVSEHYRALNDVVTEMIAQVKPPVGLLAGPWPLAADNAGVGDEVLRALLTEDWAESGMRAKQLQRLLDVQLVARNRQLGADHPRGRDLGITVDGEVVGRVLLDLDDDTGAIDSAAVTLVDIAVHPQRQRQGTGKEILQVLLGAAGSRPVRLTAVFGTHALAWFLASGFTETGGDALYHQLEWRA